MKKTSFLLLSILVFVLIGYGQEQPIQQIDTKAPLTLTIKSDKEVYESGEEVIIFGQIKNISEKDVFIYPLEWTLTVTYEVIDSKGKKIDVPLPISDLWPPTKNDFVLIKAGGLLQKSWGLSIVDEDLQFLPDVYTIMVRYEVREDGYYENGKFVDLDAWTGTLVSNIITIEVKGK